MSEAPSIICPRCGWKSYNPNDVEQRYCGRCHQFHEDMFEALRREVVELLKTMVDRRHLHSRHPDQVHISREVVNHLLTLLGATPIPLPYGGLGARLSEAEGYSYIRSAETALYRASHPLQYVAVDELTTMDPEDWKRIREAFRLSSPPLLPGDPTEL